MEKNIKIKLADFDPHKHSPDSLSKKINDLFFVLLVLSKGEEKNITITNGILIKTLFSAKIDLAEKDLHFLKTGFYPYKLGPFNKIFYSYIEELTAVGLIQKDGYNLSLTPKGLSLVQPLFEDMKKIDGQYAIIESNLEENLEKCKRFFRKVNELHEMKLIDEVTNDIVTMEHIIKNIELDKYANKYIESTKEPKQVFNIPSKIVNQLFNIESGVTEGDYKEVCAFSDVGRFFESVGK